MDHGVTIRADRTKVFDWVNLVFPASVGNGLQVMHMDESFSLQVR